MPAANNPVFSKTPKITLLTNTARAFIQSIKQSIRAPLRTAISSANSAGLLASQQLLLPRNRVGLVGVNFLEILKRNAEFEARGKSRVEIRHFPDVAVELTDELYVPSETLRHLDLLVLVDLVDEQVVVVQQVLHLARHAVEDGQHP